MLLDDCRFFTLNSLHYSSLLIPLMVVLKANVDFDMDTLIPYTLLIVDDSVRWTNIGMRVVVEHTDRLNLVFQVLHLLWWVTKPKVASLPLFRHVNKNKSKDIKIELQSSLSVVVHFGPIASLRVVQSNPEG